MSDEAGQGADAPRWPDISVPPQRRRRDWRWWVGSLGRVLVATGLLLLAFVGYQLWGTGIQTRQAQNQLESEFDDVLSTSTTPTAPSTSAGAPGTTTTAPPTTPATTLPPVPGDPVARMEAPKIGLDWIVVSGVGVDDLKKGPGHYPDTPLPGQAGNVGIAGHRTTYGAPFFRIDELATGDDVVLTTPAGRYVYVVTEQFIVPPSQYDVLAPTDGAILTLTSCHPRYSAKKRIIVRATLDPAQSSPLADTAPVETTTTPTTAASTPSTTAEGVTSPANTASTAPATTVDAAAIAGASALERGWFDDPDAWPQVALWGLGLTAISLLAWRLSRRTGHRWIGALAGIVPFLFCLYFFFENVNRLLPPNI